MPTKMNKGGFSFPGSRAPKARRFQSRGSARVDPAGMSTKLVGGPQDPPPTDLRITGVKRLRKKLQLAAGTGIMTLGNVRSCLALGAAYEFRVMKFSVWASAGANSLLQVTFPTASDGDFATYADEGTQGAVRPQVHLMPNFQFRSRWFGAADDTQNLANFVGTATDLLVVDVTVEYRSSSQSCPA